MKNIDFNNKTFALIENSKKGEVNRETIFEFMQKGDLVTADYQGGTIRYGKIIARLHADELSMIYQCLTVNNKLKAGKAQARISFTNMKKLKLDVDWQWITDTKDKGTSQFIEID